MRIRVTTKVDFAEREQQHLRARLGSTTSQVSVGLILMSASLSLVK